MRSDKLKFAILAAFLLGTVPAWAQTRFPVGDWFGQGQPQDKSEMWIAHMGADGSFKAQFRACIKGKAFDSVQTGTWILSGDVETIRITSVNGHPVLRADLYRVLAHTAKEQTYRYEATGFVYRSHRVAATFQMPPCDLVS